MVQRPKNGRCFHGHLGSFDTGYRDLLQVNKLGGTKQMTDTNILIFGIVVFGLMLVGVVLTVVEFRQISADNATGNDSKSSRTKSESL